ncbi:MAG: response regulator [Trueperaceae bacterium]|nr:response regulator [Trueperaceae bacterium]
MDAPAGGRPGADPAGGSGDAPVQLLVAAPSHEHDLLDVLLSTEAFALTFTASAEAALAHLKDATPDAVLVALDLPDLPGDEVVRRLREVPRLERVAVVLYGDGDGAAGLSPDAHARADAVGADLLLPRPLAGKGLAARLHAQRGGTAQPTPRGRGEGGGGRPPDAPAGDGPDPLPDDPEAWARALRAARAREAELRARIAELERRNAALLDALDAQEQADDPPRGPRLGRRGRT